MSAPTFVLSETNGSGATVTDSIPEIAFASIDAASTSTLSGANAIAAGNNGFEKYNRYKLTGVAPNNLSGTGVSFSATAPTDSGGFSATLTLKYACNVSYVQPVATTSSVATTNSSTDTTTPGTSLTAPANTVNSYSAYLIEQLQTTSGAAGGNCIFASPASQLNYTWS